MTYKLRWRRLGALLLLFFAVLPVPAALLAQTSAESASESGGAIQDRFWRFLESYWPAIKAQDRAYLQSLHPKLPEEMYDLFFEATLGMMRYAEENAGVEPAVECQDFGVCKVVYPQPNDSWAAQRFILHEDAWQWLDQ